MIRNIVTEMPITTSICEALPSTLNPLIVKTKIGNKSGFNISEITLAH